MRWGAPTRRGRDARVLRVHAAELPRRGRARRRRPAYHRPMRTAGGLARAPGDDPNPARPAPRRRERRSRSDRLLWASSKPRARAPAAAAPGWTKPRRTVDSLGARSAPSPRSRERAASIGSLRPFFGARPEARWCLATERHGSWRWRATRSRRDNRERRRGCRGRREVARAFGDRAPRTGFRLPTVDAP